MFFTIYDKTDGVWLAPTRLAGRKWAPGVIAVFENRSDPQPSYLIWLGWQSGEISFIRDYRHAPHVVTGTDLLLAADIKSAGAIATA